MARMKYQAGKETAIRKHTWMPCVIANREDLSEEEYVKLMKRCYYTDYFTDAEWKAIVNDSAKNLSVHKSKIKRKVAGWLMAINRLATIRPGWYLEVLEFAAKEYKKLIGEELHYGILPDYRALLEIRDKKK